MKQRTNKTKIQSMKVFLFTFSLLLLTSCRTATYSILTDKPELFSSGEGTKIKSIYDYQALNERLSDSLIYTVTVFDYTGNSFECSSVSLSPDSITFISNLTQKTLSTDFIQKIEVVEKYFRNVSSSLGSTIRKSLVFGAIACIATFMIDLNSEIQGKENASFTSGQQLAVSAAVTAGSFIYLMMNEYYQAIQETIVFPKFIITFQKDGKL